MSSEAGRDRAHLFMLRVWAAEPGAAATAWRGKVQSLPDGEAYHFHTWEGLITHLQAMMESGRSDNTDSEPGKGDKP